MQDTNILIEKLSKAVSFQYPGKAAPSVVVSFLPNQEWYVSICRYEDGHADKQVMHKTRNKSLTIALQDISRQLLASVVRERDPLDDLNMALK